MCVIFFKSDNTPSSMASRSRSRSRLSAKVAKDEDDVECVSVSDVWCSLL